MYDILRIHFLSGGGGYRAGTCALNSSRRLAVYTVHGVRLDRFAPLTGCGQHVVGQSICLHITVNVWLIALLIIVAPDSHHCLDVVKWRHGIYWMKIYVVDSYYASFIMISM